MNGELALLIALVTYGNAYFHGNLFPNAPELTLSNSTCKGLSVEFLKEKELFFGFKTTKKITGTEKWFRDLKERGAKRLWFIDVDVKRDLSNRIASSFVGGGNWAIQVDYDNSSEIWVPVWGRKEVVFREFVLDRKRSVEETETNQSLNKLLDALKCAEEFSRKIKFHEWESTFKEIIDNSRNSDLRMRYYSDMIPDGKDFLKERHLIAVASSAWVFGGMGSWNDLPSYGNALDKEYEKKTDELYSATVEALKAGSNRLFE
jgi:hypothetical protein